MALLPVKPLMGIFFIFPSEVGKEVIGFDIFTLRFGGSGGCMDGCEDICAENGTVKSLAGRNLARPLEKEGYPDPALVHLPFFSP